MSSKMARWLIGLFGVLFTIMAAAAQDAAPATIVVTVPAEAKLYFDGTLTQLTGTTRTFSTPPLQRGSDYFYQLKAEIVRDGQPVTADRKITIRAGETSRVDFSTIGAESGDDEPDVGWPRKFVRDGTTVTVYQPQLEKWDQLRLEARAAVSVETKVNPQPAYGVLWITARTLVNKEQRQVVLNDFAIPKVSFPASPDKEKDYLEILRKSVPQQSRTIALDRLQAGLAVTQAEARTKTTTVKNEPPKVFFSTKPAVLVLIDGAPALRQVENVKLLRVINTRALILLDQSNGTYYLHLVDRWLQTKSLEGPWEVAAQTPADVSTVLNSLKDNPQVDLLDDPASDITDVVENGQMPAVYVSTVPAELIETTGEPDLAPIDGTKLLWVKNSTDQLLLDTADQNYYALISGRWFRGKKLEGPWEFVAANKLPPDFAKIPTTHPRGDVLASVSGTPQSKEALIAQQVPQTAAIKRTEAKMEPVYDGEPQFQPIEETKLQYAANCATPIIQVDPNSYYGIENGVWFSATTPAGPWNVAGSVPPVVYTIPSSSPIYYVTGAYIYDSTPDLVYTGYTPLYFGTCVCPEDVVVFGTGHPFRPWIGRWWIGRPWSYGWGARFAWTGGGWGFGFATGVGRPWWGPIGWNSTWGGTAWRAGWHNGWGGNYNNVHINHLNFNNVNIYNRWNDNVHVNSVRRNTLATTQAVTARRGVNNVVAGADGGVYRRAANGWETHAAAGWRPYQQNLQPVERRPQFDNNVRGLNTDWSARRTGEANFQNFRSSTGSYSLGSAYNRAPQQSLGGYGGYHGGYNGFRGGGGAMRGGRR